MASKLDLLIIRSDFDPHKVVLYYRHCAQTKLNVLKSEPGRCVMDNKLVCQSITSVGSSEK